METFKSIFNAAMPDFTVDAKLIQNLRDFERKFVNRNEDHIAFFGGNLTGVNPMRWTPSDRSAWFEELLDMDEDLIADGIKRLPHNQDWIRGNDVFNLSCVWLIYRIQSSTISPALKEEGSKLVIQLLQYKFLGSLLYRFWGYPADEGTAQATLAAMSRKFLIKTSASWHALLEERAKEMISTRSVHRRAFTTMDVDLDVIKMINDIQNRLKEMIKAIAKIFYDLHGKGVRVNTERSVMDIDGTIVLKDRSRQYTTLIRYLHDVMDDSKSFIRDDLVDVIADAMHTMNPKLLVESLEWMSNNRRSARDKKMLDELTDEVLIHAFTLINSDRELYNARGGLSPLISKLRALYMAPRMANPTLLRTKELSEKVVFHATNSRNPSMIAAVRTGLQMYLVLRAMAMNFYQNSVTH